MKKKTPKAPLDIRTAKILYSYVGKQNRKFAMTAGKKRFGSQSAYVSHLITADRKRQAARSKAA